MMIGFADPSVHGVYDFVGCFPNITANIRNVTDDLFLEAVILSEVDPRFKSSAFLSGGEQSLASSPTVLYQSTAPVSLWWDTWTGGCYCERYKQHTGSVASFLGAVKNLQRGMNITWSGNATALPLDNVYCECTTTCTRTKGASGGAASKRRRASFRLELRLGLA